MGSRLGVRGTIVAALATAALAVTTFTVTTFTVATTATADAPAITHNKATEPANLGLVKNDIKTYYGDYLDAAGHHHASDRSAWATQTAAQVQKAKQFLVKQLANGVHNPAMVLDIDDTSELTYGLTADNDFGYDAKKSEDAINKGEFPAIKPTLDLANWATQRGVRLFFITGRPEHQRTGTAKGLAALGFPQPAGLFLKPETVPVPYLPCKLTCNTIQYKSGTRAHLEQQGNTIVINIGDQYSDLEGGYAEQGFKLPNPMYYLP